MSAAYYNEVNAHAAGWLRNLVAAGLICAGDVDDRDIRDVCADDLKGYTQHHFFAGIGIWSLALRMAGWPDDRPVTTGSCPCQPFSGAGKGDGFADERHLWPAWHWLIGQYRPDTIFGEQVADKGGRSWLDLVSADLETLAYAFAPVVLPAACLGAPNIRHRFFWVADADPDGWAVERHQRGQRGQDVDGRGAVRGLADAGGGRRNLDLGIAGQQAGAGLGRDQSEHGGAHHNRLGDASRAGLPHAEPQGAEGPGRRDEGRATEQPSGPCDPWRELEWIACLDGRRRPTQPGLFPLAARHPGDVAKLRAYGNAISPQVAAEVIRAYMEQAS
jgi:DNA (cytosine-5)-methyltransferase 1